MSKTLFIALAAGQQNSGIWNMLFLGGIFVVFYFFFIRPQMKKQKAVAKFRDALKKGDKVITNGGIYGKIAEMKDTTITLEVEDGSRMKVAKSAIIQDMTDLAK